MRLIQPAVEGFQMEKTDSYTEKIVGAEPNANGLKSQAHTIEICG